MHMSEFTAHINLDNNKYTSSSSSFYWASVANAPNVLQPYWFIVLPLDVPDLTASLLLWGPSGQKWRCLWTFLYSNVQLSPWVVFKRSQQPKVELHGREMVDEFCLKMPDFHVTFRDLLHAVNLRHGTDGFTSPPKEGVLRIFFALKNPTASVGFEPANFGTKGQQATSRPPKPPTNTLPLMVHWKWVGLITVTVVPHYVLCKFWDSHSYIKIIGFMDGAEK